MSIILRKIYHRFIVIAMALCFLSVWQHSTLTAWALPVLTDAEMRAAIPVESNAIPNWPAGPLVSAQSAILIDAESGVILYAKNIHEPLYPASTTKLLTCLIAAETCAMDEIVTFSYEAVFDTPRDSNHIAMDVGYELTMEQCLNAILIASANEVSFAVAEHITGTTWQDFADTMNARAEQLGCVDSHFVNPNGLPDENHYTSSHDLAMIGRAFFANELLCKISSSLRLDIPATDKQPKHVIENAKNQLLPGKTYAYEYLVGSKTGYTEAARGTLVSCAEKDGMKLIAVVMAEDTPSQYVDTVALFNYGFSNFERINISQTETRYNIDNASFFYSNNDIFGSSKPLLSLNQEDYIVLPKTVPFEDVVSSISYDTQDEGVAAVISYTYQGQFIGSVSVDFAQDEENRYAFEDGALQSSFGESSDSPKAESNIIFINVFKVFLWIIGIACAFILIISLHAFIVNYQFATKERSGRRGWLRRRRLKQNRYPDRQRARVAARRRKKAKRPSRFRDLDF